MKLAQALCSLALPCLLFAQPVKEGLLKAAFVYNFIMFTEWPSQILEGKKEITLCVNGSSKMQPHLTALNGKVVRQWALKVQTLGQVKTGMQTCQILYLDHTDTHNWPEIRQSLEGNSTLTISDDGRIGREGAMIKLERSGNKMVFDINQGAVQRSGLYLSSKLLRLARRVH